MTDEAVQIADFLKANPDFLVNNPGILAFVRLPEQGAGNVSSLHDRQIQTLREKVKALEHRIVEMTHAAVENQAIINNLQTISRHLLTVKSPSDLAPMLVSLIRKHFSVPMVCLNLWTEASGEQQAEKDLFDSLHGVYCGFSDHAPSLQVFSREEIKPRSVVLIPLRVGASPETFGVLGLGSPDKDRFAPTLETDFLNALSELACAALSRLPHQAQG